VIVDGPQGPREQRARDRRGDDAGAGDGAPARPTLRHLEAPKVRQWRYRYLYSAEELDAAMPLIESAAAEATRTIVFFNNCYGNYGATNARGDGGELGTALMKDPIPLSGAERVRLRRVVLPCRP